MSVNPKYALQNVPGKGKGLVATQDIPKGTRITEETLIIRGLNEHLGDFPFEVKSMP